MVTETNEPSSFQINKLTEGRRKRINPGNLNSMLGPYTLNIKEKKPLNVVCWSGMGLVTQTLWCIF